MKIKTDSNENKDSIVTLVTKQGEFTGIAKLHEEDREEGTEPNFSSFSFAQDKAVIKWLKYNIKSQKQKIKIIKDFFNSVASCKNFDNQSPIVKSMYRLMNVEDKKLKSLQETLETMETRIQSRLHVQKKISDKRAKSGNQES